MPGIYVMAALTIFGTAILCIAALNYLTQSDRRYYWLILAGLPLSLIVNRLIKIPFITGTAGLAGIPLKLGSDTPLWFIFVIWLTSPVFEEAIKMLPIFIPIGRKFLRVGIQALDAGLALGLGFGLGEAAYLAYGIAQSPDYNQLPWYMFTGFASERLIVTFGHGFMTSLAILGLHRGGRNALYGYLSAVGLHALINLGPVLAALKLIPVAVSSMGSYAVILVAYFIFQKNMRILKKTSGTEPVETVYFQR
jgi:uncharacterized membrane protein YhfC